VCQESSPNHFQIRRVQIDYKKLAPERADLYVIKGRAVHDLQARAIASPLQRPFPPKELPFDIFLPPKIYRLVG
jgi:hypothetical protein